MVLAICLFVCRRRVVVGHWRAAAAGDARPRRCRDTCALGVLYVFRVKKKFPHEIYDSDGGLLVVSINVPHLFYQLHAALTVDR